MDAAAPAPGRWQRLWQWLKALKQQYDQVQGEATMESLRRFRVFTCVTFAMNLVYTLAYWFFYDTRGNGVYVRYANAIGWANLCMGMASVVLGLAVFRLLRHNQRGSYRAIVLQLLLCASALSFAIALAVIDQMVTTSITPFVMVCVLISVLSLMRPLMGASVFGLTYLVFCSTIGLTQLDPVILARQYSDAALVVVLSFVLSVLVFRQYVTAVLLRRDIVRANQALADKQAELAFTATHDELTGLYNRREFTRLALLELARTARVPGPTCMLILDIDFFKKINDQHGHPTGDAVLQQLAQMLTQGVRSIDVVARLGGEEFIVLLPNTERAGACAVAEKLRATLARAPMQLPSLALPVTASFGLSELPAGVDGTMEDLYRAADQALYVAKRQGRNRVEFDVVKFGTPDTSEIAAS